MRDLVFYFDFLSPYAYIAASQVHSLAARNGARVDLAPVLLARFLDAHGTKGPAEVPAKRAYTIRDAIRKATALNLPIRPPPSHPFNPLPALRVASLPMDDDARRRLVAALFHATWGNGRGVDGLEAVAAAASEAGFDGPALAAAATSAEAKDRVRDRTEEAVARGVFGVPTLWIDGELFWGVDSLPFAEAHLRGEDPVPRDFTWNTHATAARKQG